MLLARWLLAGRLGPAGMLAVGIGLGGVLLIVYLGALRHLGVRWVAEIEARLLHRGGGR